MSLNAYASVPVQRYEEHDSAEMLRMSRLEGEAVGNNTIAISCANHGFRE